MAPANFNSSENCSNKPCKRCQKIAHMGPKCAKCGVVSHASCVDRLRNVIQLENNEIICCTSVEDIEHGGDAQEQPDNEALKVEISYLKKINMQNDLIISNQQLLIKSLKEQIELINEKQNFSQPVATSINPSVNRDKNHRHEPIKQHKSSEFGRSSSSAPKNNLTSGQNSTTLVTHVDVIDNKNKQTISSNFNKKNKKPIVDQTSNDEVKNNQQYSTKKSIKRGSYGTGNPNVHALKAVPSVCNVFISRLDPTTSEKI